MEEPVTVIRFSSDSRAPEIQRAAEKILGHIRSQPPVRAADGRLLLDLSDLCGLAPIDLEAAGVGDLDVTRVQISVEADSAGLGGALVGVLVVAGVAGGATLVDHLQSFVERVVRPAVSRMVSRDALTSPDGSSAAGEVLSPTPATVPAPREVPAPAAVTATGAGADLSEQTSELDSGQASSSSNVR